MLLILNSMKLFNCFQSDLSQTYQFRYYSNKWRKAETTRNRSE